MLKKQRGGLVPVWSLLCLLALPVAAMEAPFPLPIPSRPAGFPLIPPAKAGTVVAWGAAGYDQTNIPPGLTGVVAVAAGVEHFLALNRDGTVAAWGRGSEGETMVPAGLAGVVAIAAGRYHSVALKKEGTVVAWGAGGPGPIGNPNFGQSIVPAGLTSVVAIAAGAYHTLALKQDGTVVGWGAGAPGTEGPPHFGQATVDANLRGVVAIAAGWYYTAAVNQDGFVVAWGCNTAGQTDVPSDLPPIVAIAAGEEHTLGLKSDGTVVAWGYNFHGQTNVPQGLEGVVSVAAGWSHSVALKADGTVVAWGRHDHGETNVPAGLSGVVAIAAGGYQTIAEVRNENPTVLVGGRVVKGNSFTNRGPATVMLQSTFSNGLIFYTLDGADAALGLLYEGPFTVKRTAVLTATCFNPDFTQSDENSVTITIQPELQILSNGGGVIAVAPADGPWPNDSLAAVTASPAEGCSFLGWLGDNSSTDQSIAVLMNRRKVLKGIFGTTLTVAAIGAGTTVCEPACAQHPYGSTVRLTAIPQPGNYFVTWGGAASGAANPNAFGLSTPTPTVSAVFATLPGGKRALTVIPRGRGSVDRAPSPLYYTSGAVVALTAVPNSGQGFLGWSGDLTGAVATVSVILNSNKIITANFTARPQIAVSSLDGMTPEGFRASFAGQLGAAYTFEASSNLETWGPIGTLTNTLGTVQFNDPVATNSPARAYRAILIR